jgi:hypothetical protein
VDFVPNVYGASLVTYCLGLLYRNSVYLFGDAAVTRPAAVELSGSVSSFGEAAHSSPHARIDEGALKIVTIAPNCAMAVAGDSSRAFNIAEMIRDNYSVEASIPEQIERVRKSIDTSTATHCEFLLGRVTAKGPELWAWSTSTERLVQVSDLEWIGGFSGWQRDLSELCANLAREGKLVEERLLSVVAASMQSHSVTDLVLPHGVGGVVAALQISERGTKWLPDTNYVVYGRDLDPLHLVTVASRGGAIAVRSSFNDETRFFLTSLSEGTPESWSERWIAELVALFDECAARVWVFLANYERSSLLVFADANVTEISGFVVKRVAPGKYDIAVHDTLRAALMAPLQDRGDGSVPIRLSCADARTVLDWASKYLSARAALAASKETR